jgi:hypothetical protein
MKTLTTTCLAPLGLLVLGTLAASLPRGDALVFRSVAETTLEKKFVQHSAMDLVEFKVSIEAPDGPQEPDVELPKVRIVDDETIEFTDETLAAGEGRPDKSKRTFATIDNAVTFETEGGEDEEGGAETMKNVSGLLGKSVLFTWDGESEEFEAAWSEDETGDDDLLADLVEDADFRGWLPGKEVDEGDTWTIPSKEFNNLQEPSGPMGYHREGEEKEDDGDSDELRKNVEGEIKATYKGTRDEGGVKVGVIAFEAELQSKSEREIEQEEGPATTSTTENAIELEGELLWDVAAGRFHALNCDSEFKLTTGQTRVFEFDSNSVKIKESRVFEGKKTYRFTCAKSKD